MILGIGTDIVEVERIKSVLSRFTQRFIERVFTDYEREYCLKHKEPAIHFAGRFAAKEAVAKALGTGFTKDLNWLDIEIRNDEKGKPFVHFPFPSEIHQQRSFHISISHCRQYATAFAICTGNL